jgi:glucose/arabinose dehydrogenase
VRVILGMALLLPAVAQPPVNSRPFRLEELKTPPGFEASIYAHVPSAPRLMTFGPNGALYVAAGPSVFAAPAPGSVIRAASGFSGAHSVVFRGADLYVAAADGVYRLKDALTADLEIRSQPEKIVDLPVGAGHSTRTMVFGPDGRMYVSAGSSCNFCVESDGRRAAITRYEADGSGATLFARGLRNSVGLAWHPLTGELWATDNGGDGLGDDVPPEEINVIREGGDYGWPDCYADQRAVNWGLQAQPGRCASTLGPEVAMQAHSAPLGISFYTGRQFPSSYIGDAFVAFHGSWNRNTPTGYKVVRVRASSGRGAGYEDFLWGFLDLSSRTRSGRPVHALAGPDGALYVSDDATGNIYRVAYVGPRIRPRSLLQRGRDAFEVRGENLAGQDAARVAVSADGIACRVLSAERDRVRFVMPEMHGDEVTITVQNDAGADSVTFAMDARRGRPR